ncbi:hypothetical protein ACFQJ5_19880 [Halomicroarcula sp. GCM10025324]|uniref:hypothetical protein n=1 Tax=Halomicroarcula sp. GCM10025324 TaxID=3252667 RepID=UPI0036164CC5
MNGASVAGARRFVYGSGHSLKQKVEFGQRYDGGFERIEAVWNGCQRRMIGREVVTKMRRIWFRH